MGTEEWKDRVLEKVKQALSVERWGEGYNSLKVSILIDLENKESTVDVNKRSPKA